MPENDVLLPRFERAAKNLHAGNVPSAAAAEDTTQAVPAALATAPAIQPRGRAASAAANPYSGASLVPMLVGGLVLIVVTMIVAVALS